MYTVPSYVTYRTEEDAIYITSELYRNTVRLTDHGLQKGSSISPVAAAVRN